ncbi:hypothetical protein ACJMK2_011695 [Sinanodonta woodiana]|uniref:Uncharacterized protein n=1 Tax=Sinanodonta woodiana TaxID=1069815 RepID=A0ABD3V732_SINWO
MENVLNDVDDRLSNVVFDNGALVLDESTLSHISHDDFSVANLVQHSFALVVYYGPMDIHIIPKGLTYEMFRSTSSDPVAEADISHWIPIANVGPSLYLYFLQYQCFHLQGRMARTSVALSNMIWMYTQELDRFVNCMSHDVSEPY